MEISEDSIFQTTTFEGRVSTENLDERITFVAHAADDCRLNIDPLIVPGHVYVALIKTMARPGGQSEPFTLVGMSRDGIKFFSQNMRVQGYRVNTEFFQIQIAADEASITLPRERGSATDDIGLILSLRGFKSFRPNPVQAQLGRVEIQGAHAAISADDVSGRVIIQCENDLPLENWYQHAKSLAKFVWRGLQFGHGGRLQVPLIQEYRPDKVIATFYSGSGRVAHLPAIHLLDQSEFIAALVSRFESDDPFPDDVWQAVGWLNSDTTIDEIRYLTLMTAVETVLDTLIPDAPSTLIPKEEFKPIREALIETLGEFELSDEEKSVFGGNIKGINRAPISRKLRALVNKYDLSPNDFDDDMIRRLNKQRNSITHRGKALDGENLWDSILYARELIALIVFAELHYKGSYQKYAGGHEQRSLAAQDTV